MKLLLLFLFVIQTYADTCGYYNETCGALEHCADANNDGDWECVFNADHLGWIVPVAILVVCGVCVLLPRQDR